MDRRLLRPAALVGHLLVLVAVLVCLRLGWWQWDRAHEATGTAQNWGYALLWPCFAVSFVYMWVKFLRLEQEKDVDDERVFDDGLAELLGSVDDTPDGESGEPVAGPTATPGVTATGPVIPSDNRTESGQDQQPAPATPASALPAPTPSGPPSRSVILSVATVGDDDSEDPELAAYNRALAELAEKDRNRAT